MSTGTGAGKSRSQRLGRFSSENPGAFSRVLFDVQRLRRLLFYTIFIGTIAIINESWYPAFFYQMDYVPQRSIASRVEFSAVDAEGTLTAKRRARQNAFYIYDHNNKPLTRMIEELHQALDTIRVADDYNNVPYRTWEQFMPLKEDGGKISGIQMKQCFSAVKSMYKDDEKLAKFDSRLNEVLSPYKERGILQKFEVNEQLGETRSDYIKTISPDNPQGRARWRSLDDIVIKDWVPLQNEIKRSFGEGDLSDMLFRWIKLKLPNTLELDLNQTETEMNREMDKVQDMVTTYNRRDIIALAGKPISASEWHFLYLEYKAWRSTQTWDLMLLRFFSTWILMCLVFFPNLYFATKMRLKIVDNLWQAIMLCILTLTVIIASRLLTNLGCNAQCLVMFMYGIGLSVAYGRKTTLLLLSCVIFVSVLGSGGGITDLLYLTGVMGLAVLPLDRIRNRKKIIFIAFGTALIAFVLAITCNVLNYQPLNISLVKFAGVSALWIVAGGFLMHGLLPFEERIFGIVTDTQLLELSDAAHPLLQELIQRAPSTYNHSMLVATIAENAARSIGAWGLLCRVGGYYHDIGKFVTPNYFVENQKTLSESQHTLLAPSMSSLVIINHVKDGVELAHKWHLPQQVIDFIQQHHGTTLVKYFFNKAVEEEKRKREELEKDKKSSESSSENRNKNNDVLDDSPYRYPGPKPQTKEIAIVMLSDCVESACRTLVEPTPKRVEELVKSIINDKLQDGQFDETGLTFNELRAIQESMVKSLMSIYHARIRYPSSKN